MCVSMFLNYYILLPLCSQYGVYTTALEQNNVTGRTICVVRKRDHEVAAIPSQDNGTFFEIKSPKKYKTTRYSLI